MKKIILCSSILMLLLSKIINAQSTAQTFPIINLSIAPGYDRPIEDFYGLNGQNTLSATSMYANTNVNSGLAASYASYLRYPGGTVANYWDWQEGWFFRNIEKNGALSLDIDLQNKDRLQDVFSNTGLLYESGSNYIKDFIKTLGSTGTKPLFIVNPLTSDLQYQIAMLLETKLQGLEVKRVEIGNEFYLSNIGYQERFATAQDYANLTTTWRNEIRKYLGNDMQICAVGSNNDYTGSTNNRRDTWNTNLYNSISGSLPEAFSIHHYRNALPPSTTTFSSQTFFKKAIDDFYELNNYIYQFGGSSTNPPPIWLTEYNLFDREVPIHGKWYHGLYTAFNTLKFLENNRIKACNLHAQSGNYTFGNFFNTNDGLEELGSFLACNNNALACSTSVNGKTSEGIAMEQIAIALKEAVYCKRIGFNAFNGATIPTLNLPPNAEQALYGWVFDKYGVTNNSAIILNLSGSSVNNVNVDQLGFNIQDISIQLSLSNPDLYATGFSRSNGSTTEYEFLTCGSNSNTFANSISFAPVNIPSSKLITLPPYSITRLEKINNQRLYLYALNDTVKAGSKVIVSVLNNDIIPFDWDSINGNGNDSSAFIEFYPTQDTTITVRYSIPGSLTISTVSKFIKVIQSPVIVSITSTSPITNNSIDYCPGNTPIQLSTYVTGGNPTNYKYIWITTPTKDEFPDFNKGVGNTATINVSPDYPTIYTVYVTDGVTVAKASITINIPTAFNLKPEYTTCIGHTPINIDILSNPQNGIIYSYRWNNVTTILNPSPGIAINLSSSFSTKNVLTVYASDPSLGCIVSKSSTINFYQCCGTSTSSSIVVPPTSNLDQLKTLANGIFSIQSSNNGKLSIDCRNTTGNTDITFNGDFHIQDIPNTTDDFNTELELISCIVKFSEGASATVEPGYTFTIENCNLSDACNKMWKGIIVDAGTFESKNTTISNLSNIISNAEFAINSLPGGKLLIRRTDFVNNFIGIKSDKLSPDGDNLQNFNLRANKFKGDGTPLIDAYFGQPLPIGSKPYCGIKVNKVDVEIGTFINQTFNPNIFENLNAGIIAENSSLSINHAEFDGINTDYSYSSMANGSAFYAASNYNLVIEESNFKNSESGISLLKSNRLNVDKCKFENIISAISVSRCNFYDLNVTSNEFIDCRTGFYWYESTSKYPASITSNTFQSRFDDIANKLTGEEAISFYCTNGEFPLDISFNNIHNYGVGIFGLNLQGKLFKQIISNNNIDLDISEDIIDALILNFRGISLQNCSYTNVISNNVAWNGLANPNSTPSTLQGIRFESTEKSLFSLNKVDKISVGMYGSGTCKETQILCNTLTECYPSGILFDNVDLPTQGSYCGGSGNNWIGNYAPGTSNVKIDELLPSAPIYWYYLGSPINTNTQYPVPFTGNVVFPLLGTNCEPERPCGLSPYAERYLGDYNLRSDYLSRIINDSISYPINNDENKYYDKKYAYACLNDDSALVVNTIYELYLLALRTGNIGSFSEIDLLLKSGEINLAYIKNSAILYQNTMEQNLKLVNEVYIASSLTDSFPNFSASSKTTLENIAYQPAILGGEGVYRARALLGLRIEDGAAALRFGNINKQIGNYGVLVYPNPVHGFLNIESKDKIIISFSISDLAGKQLENNIVNSNKVTIQTSRINSGIYLLNCKLEDGSTFNTKISIIN